MDKSETEAQPQPEITIKVPQDKATVDSDSRSSILRVAFLAQTMILARRLSLLCK